MISVDDFKIGLLIEESGEIWRVVNSQHTTPAKGVAFVQSRLKNLRTGKVQEKTFRAGEQVAKAPVTYRNMQYLYESSGNHIFMDLETYEQVELSGEQLKDELNYMLENMELRIIMLSSDILGIVLPDTVTLAVTATDPDRAEIAGFKSAVMETGLVVNVPFFVNEGDRLIVNTADGTYVSRV